MVLTRKLVEMDAEIRTQFMAKRRLKDLEKREAYYYAKIQKESSDLLFDLLARIQIRIFMLKKKIVVN